MHLDIYSYAKSGTDLTSPTPVDTQPRVAPSRKCMLQIILIHKLSVCTRIHCGAPEGSLYTRVAPSRRVRLTHTHVALRFVLSSITPCRIHTK